MIFWRTFLTTCKISHFWRNLRKLSLRKILYLLLDWFSRHIGKGISSKDFLKHFSNELFFNTFVKDFFERPFQEFLKHFFEGPFSWGRRVRGKFDTILAFLMVKTSFERTLVLKKPSIVASFYKPTRKFMGFISILNNFVMGTSSVSHLTKFTN